MLILNYSNRFIQNRKKTEERNVNFSSMSFQGLTNMLSKRVYENDDFIQKLTNIYPNANSKIGSLPTKMLEIIKNKAGNKLQIGAIINDVQFSFGGLADILRERVISLSQLELKASDFFTNEMKKNEIIPQDASIKIKYIGEGSFGEVYRLIFRDKKRKRIFGDKALKVYYKGTQDNFSGVNAEGNSAFYIKKSIGHPLTKVNLITPYFFNSKKGFALFEMSNDSLDFPTKIINFKNLGLTHTDLHRESNFVKGRIVDFGDIKVQNPILVTNKVARRIYKKINAIKSSYSETQIKMRRALWEKYYNLAIANKLPQRNDVLMGLKAAKALIPLAERSQLQFFCN